MHMKPAGVKGEYVKGIAVSATMSPGIADRGVTVQRDAV